MRTGWSRNERLVQLDLAQARALFVSEFPNMHVKAIVPTLGGLANSNYRLSIGDSEATIEVLLRIWQRDPGQAQKEIALLRLVGRSVPVPKVVFFRNSDDTFGLPYAALEWISAEQLQLAMLHVGDTQRRQLGVAVGHSLAAIHRHKFEQQGFLDTLLNVNSHVDFGREGLLSWLHTCLTMQGGEERLGRKLTKDVMHYVEQYGHILNHPWALQPCLTHGDFNGSNILVKWSRGNAWVVGAILDWEFSFAGGPAFDFGNLLRPPLGESVSFREGVIDGYLAAGGELPAGWMEIARVADLYSWADFLGRDNVDDQLIKDARNMILRTIG